MGTQQDVRERQLGGFADVDSSVADDFVSRLDAMHALEAFQAYKADTFGMLHLKPGSSVAEVGCGTGEDARKLAALVAPGGRVVGYDASEAMLEQARSRHGAIEGLSFRQGDLQALDAADDTFDAVRADRVLLHVKDSRAALREMLRIARPGGRVMACEPDMPGCWIAADQPEVSELVMRQIARSCVHPYMARDLWGHFRELGLKDLSLTIKTVTAFAPQAVEQILHVGEVLAGLVDQGALSGEAAAAWANDLHERGRNGRFVAGLSIMVVAGTKA